VDATSDSAAGGDGGFSCATANFALCDNFEGVAPGAATSAWTIDTKSGYVVELVTTQAHSGTHSVHVKSSGSGGLGYIVETTTFPATDFWGRAFLMFMAPAGGHEVFGAMDTTLSDSQGDQIRMLNDMGDGKMATNRRNGDHSMEGSAIPMGTWLCFEWHQSPTALSIYLNGTDQTGADETYGNASPFGGTPTLVDMRLGFEQFESGKGGDIWIDDAAVNSTQIGCTDY
jgi:hypothetical protein